MNDTTLIERAPTVPRPNLLGSTAERLVLERLARIAVGSLRLVDGATTRDFALSVFRLVVTLERQLAAAVGALLRGLGAPARDLHTGDAQEYLLFLVGLSVLSLLLPLLR